MHSPHVQRRTLPFITGVAALSAAASLHAAAILRVDFGAINDLEPGFSVWNIGTDSAGPRSNSFTVSDLSAVPTGTVNATLGAGTDATNLANDTGTLNTRTRGVPVDNGAFTYDQLLKDRAVGLTGSGLFLELAGFAANTPFTIQAWGYDNAKAGNFSLVDRTNGANISLGSYSVTAGQTPTDNNSFSVTGTVTSDATGKIVVQSVSNIDGVGIFNGFVVSTVPEPATAGLLAVGVSAILGLRRRRTTGLSEKTLPV